MLQQLVDSWIIDLEQGSTATATPPVARITEFPSPEYESDGFWAQVTNCVPCYDYGTPTSDEGWAPEVGGAAGSRLGTKEKQQFCLVSCAKVAVHEALHMVKVTFGETD